MADLDYLNVYLLTFNCGRALINPSAFAPHLFTALDTVPTAESSRDLEVRDAPALIVLNLQELAPIAYAFIGGSLLLPYYDRFNEMVDIATRARFGRADYADTPSYVNVLTRNTGLTAIMTFVRSDLMGKIVNISTAEVGVGVQETGNKGACGVRISWRLDDTNVDAESGSSNDTAMNLTFISAHLAPMEEDFERRNQDYKDIVRGLVFTSNVQSVSSVGKGGSGDDDTLTHTEESAPLLREAANAQSSEYVAPAVKRTQLLPEGTGMYTSTTHVFFAGDLNYRTHNTPPSTAEVPSFPQLHVDSANPKHWSKLLANDQLDRARSAGKVLHGLTESKITFGPTYKYKFHPSNPTQYVIHSEDTESWSWASHRWPSWCDRILYSPQHDGSSSSALSPSLPRSYTALPMMTSSDHRPVALSISVPLAPVHNATFQAQQPIEPDFLHWRARRAAARRKEIVVGLASYLALMREGQIILAGSLAVVLGGWWVLMSGRTS